jgi:hypothetical protein
MSSIPRDLSLTNPLAVPDWDQRVAKFPTATFFHSAAWARVLHDTYQHTPNYIISSGIEAPSSILPVMESRSWLSGTRGIALPFTDECPPLLSPTTSPEPLVEFITRQARAKKWHSWEVRGGDLESGPRKASLGFLGHRLTLDSEPSVNFSRLESGVRRAVRKAEQSDLTVEFSTSPAASADFYRLLQLTRRRHGLPPQPFAFFQNIQRHILAGGSGFVALARHHGTPIAGAVFFHFGSHAIYKFGASDARHQQLRPNNLVMWRAIEHLIILGCATLDFGRTSLHNTGLRRFKLSWGTTERSIRYFRYGVKESKFMADTDQAHGWHNQIFRILPPIVSRRLGEFAYRHLA